MALPWLILQVPSFSAPLSWGFNYGDAEHGSGGQRGCFAWLPRQPEDDEATARRRIFRSSSVANGQTPSAPVEGVQERLHFVSSSPDGSRHAPFVTSHHSPSVRHDRTLRWFTAAR